MKFKETKGTGMHSNRTYYREKNITGSKMYTKNWILSNAKYYIKLGRDENEFLEDMKFTNVPLNVLQYLFAIANSL